MTKRIYILIFVFCLCLSLLLCKKKTPFEPETPEPSVQVTLSFKIYNHTQGLIKNYTKKATAGEGAYIRISELEVSGVDDKRIVIREENFGEFVEFSRLSEAAFIAPQADKNYDIYLMNASNGADYNIIDEWVDKGKGLGILRFPRNITYHREDRDGYTGSQGIIDDAVLELNRAIQYSWVQYGSITEVAGGGDFGVGYGYCNNWLGDSTDVWVGVNPDKCKRHNIKEARVFISEIYELVTRTDDLGGGLNSFEYITDVAGNLKPFAKDLIAYVFVKDEK